MTVIGVDVSQYQREPDFAACASAGYSFAIAKATEGAGWTDKTFARNWQAIRAAGLIRGAYHFGRPASDPIKQADHFAKVMGPLGPGDLPPALDLEAHDDLKPLALVEWTIAFLEHIEAITGRWPMLYTGPGFWQRRLKPAGDAALKLTSWPYWTAQYHERPEPDARPWARWTIWQHSGHGKVPGFSGDVDLNRFNGTLDDLRTLACLGGTA